MRLVIFFPKYNKFHMVKSFFKHCDKITREEWLIILEALRTEKRSHLRVITSREEYRDYVSGLGDFNITLSHSPYLLQMCRLEGGTTKFFLVVNTISHKFYGYYTN